MRTSMSTMCELLSVSSDSDAVCFPESVSTDETEKSSVTDESLRMVKERFRYKCPANTCPRLTSGERCDPTTSDLAAVPPAPVPPAAELTSSLATHSGISTENHSVSAYSESFSPVALSARASASA